MAEEQTPQTSDAEFSEMAPPFEDEERWLFKVLGIKSNPSSAPDDDTDKKEEESPSHNKSLLRLQDQENKISSTDDNDAEHAAYTEEDDETSHSDSDTEEDNVKVIIGDIKTNPSMYMEMLANQNSKAEQDAEITASDNAMNPTD